MPSLLRPLLALLALALSTLPGRASAAAPSYAPAPCVGDFAGLPWKVQCGTLVVDETRGGSTGRRVAMPVTVVKALHPKAGLPPLIYLHGGPGGGAVEGVAPRLRSRGGADLIAQDQDWIFFDQRGGELSAPVLDCGHAALNDAGPISDATEQELEACGRRWAAAGVDLSRYNAREVALDVQDLRRALGLKSFDLYGGSYGTRIGFAVLTHAPQGVRAVVLDSVWPPEAMWAQGGPQMISGAVKVLFDRCAADAKCRAAYPDPAGQLRALSLRLLSGPVTKGRRTYTSDDLGGFLMDQIYSNEGAKSLPRDVYALNAGDFTALNEQIAERSPYVEGQHLTHLCKEEIPFERRDQVAVGTENDPVARLSVRSFQRYFDVCRAWPVGPADPVEQQPVSSPVPTLFLSAEIDPGCPPPLAEAAARRFSHGQYVMIPNETHGVVGRSVCARKMMRAFLADPSAPVDKSCLHPEHDRFAFVTP